MNGQIAESKIERNSKDLATIIFGSTLSAGVLSSLPGLRSEYPILNYSGDCLLASYNVFSGSIGKSIKHAGIRHCNKTLEKIGYFFPEITSSLLAAYIIAMELGADILPSFLGKNNPDINDIPLALLTIFSSYIITKDSSKQL